MKKQFQSPQIRVHALQAAWDRLHQDSPRLLYHYTSADGLLGMLQGRQLWATNVRFMNDTSELAYGIRLVREVLQESSETIGRVAAKTRTVIQTYRTSML